MHFMVADIENPYVISALYRIVDTHISSFGKATFECFKETLFLSCPLK